MLESVFQLGGGGGGGGGGWGVGGVGGLVASGQPVDPKLNDNQT